MYLGKESSLDREPLTLVEKAESCLEMYQILNQPEIPNPPFDDIEFIPDHIPGRTLRCIVVQQYNGKQEQFDEKLIGVIRNLTQKTFTILFMNEQGIDFSSFYAPLYKMFIFWNIE